MTLPHLRFVALFTLTIGASDVSGQAAENPHGVLPGALTCTSCHTTSGWTPLRDRLAFDHDVATRFPLDGRHADATCVRCHAGLRFEPLGTAPDDCGSCHLDVHEGTLNRPCASCHTTEAFTDFDRAAVHPADFPLAGAHLQTSCESCHTDDLGGAFTPLDTECATCHMAEYVASSLVDHRQLGFGMDCTECHTLLDFRDVAYDHFLISSGFELVGRHAGIECTACHSEPGGGVPWVVTGPEDCVGCHRSDYDREHRGSGFPTDCVSCHNEFEWEGVDFDHRFEIFSGPHAREGCESCHLAPGDFTTFSCTVCHLQPKMDDTHKEERGYVYESVTCLSCHPTGR